MSEKHYTFHVYCTIKMQHTFTEPEVQNDPDGEPESVEPTDAALNALEVELQEYLSETYSIEEIEVSTDSDLILHDPRDAPTS